MKTDLWKGHFRASLILDVYKIHLKTPFSIQVYLAKCSGLLSDSAGCCLNKRLA